MIRLEQKKTSKYIVYIGYAMKLYCDSLQEAEDKKRLFSNAVIEKIEK